MNKKIFLLAIGLLLFTGNAFAQVSIAPYPRFKAFYEGTGTPCSGCSLYTCLAGTTCGPSPSYPKATYTDSTGQTANSNPVVLDTNGEGDVWLSGYYAFALYDQNGVLIWSRNNVSSMPALQQSSLQFIPQSATVTYIGPTSFSLPGPYTSVFPAGTAIQATISGGNIYGVVSSSSYGSNITTINVGWWSTQLNSSVSAVAAGIITPPGNGSAFPLYPTVPITSSTVFTYASMFQEYVIGSLSANITLTLPSATGLPSGAGLRVKNATSTNYTVQWQTTIDGVTTPYLPTNADWYVYTDGSVWHAVMGVSPASFSTASPVRQTVLSGPVDSNGNANFGGSTGGTSVTMSGTLIVTAANGFTAQGAPNDIVGSGQNLSWTSIPAAANTYFLYVTVNNNGTLTTGVTPAGLTPIYEWGGTPSTTNGQFTYNIQAMQGFMGNGSTAPQANIVMVGEVTTNGTNVSAITWYALMGRYTAPWTATLPGSGVTTSINHNLGIYPMFKKMDFLCTTNDSGIGQFGCALVFDL